MLKKILLFAFILLLLLFPQAFGTAVDESIHLCLTSVVPSLFLFLCACELLRRQNLISNRFPLLQPLLLGVVCGYPVGAKEVCSATQNKRMTRTEASQVLPLCSGASPAFLASFVGVRLFGGAGYGLLIWLTQLLCSLTVHFLLHRTFSLSPRLYSAKPSPPFWETLLLSIRSAASTLFSVCSLILFFASLSSVIASVFPSAPQEVRAFLFGLVEMTSGLSHLSLPSPLTAALCAFLTAFGGVCITAQTLLFTQQQGISLRPYLKAKALTALLSAGVSFLVFFLIFGS